MRFLTRISVLLLAVALVPLLRFIDFDACRDPSAAPYPIEGVSKQDHRGVVIDRKDNLRFVTRVRAALTGGDDTPQWNDSGVLLASHDGSGSSMGTEERLPAPSVVALVSAPKGTPTARGPPL